MKLEKLDTASLDPDVLRQIDDVIAEYETPALKLMMILSRAQKINGHLPPELQLYIARKLNVPAARINGIVSFYSLFIEEPDGRYNIAVCMGTACFVKGADKLLKAVRDELKLKKNKKISKDGLFSLNEVRCVGACGLAPVMRVNDKIYGHVTVDDVKRILDHYREEARSQDSGASSPTPDPAGLSVSHAQDHAGCTCHQSQGDPV